jgi:CubicO group peptidase (beta-lactamase class C family)
MRVADAPVRPGCPAPRAGSPDETLREHVTESEKEAYKESWEATVEKSLQRKQRWSVVSAMGTLLLAALCAIPPVHAAGLVWPGSELSGHARAWFAMLAADEAGARTFFAEHMAPEAMAEVGPEARLERRAATLARTGGLTPLEIVEDGVTQLGVRCRAGNGDEVVVMFEAEAGAPHRILGVRLEAGPPGSGGPAPRPSGPPLADAEAVKQARALLDARAAAGQYSGVTLLARGDDVLLNGAWGDADRARKTPNTPGTRFNVGSIGKLFTRTAVAQLAEQGKLSLDDKLSRWLPDFPHADSITVAMLCAHRSGVGDIFNDRYQAMDRSQLKHNHDYLALIRDQPLWFAPGTSERYSNGGYVLLGEVIAKASGEDYYDYLAKHVYGPAGMKDTGAPVEGDGTKGLAHGYTKQGAAQGERDNAATRPARGSAAGGSYSTAADLLAFDRALLGGRLCSSREYAEWVTGGPRPEPGAAGSPTPPTAPPPPQDFGFAGGAPGVSAEWMHEGDRVLIVLTNRDPETAKGTVQPLGDIFRRMQPTQRLGGS